MENDSLGLVDRQAENLCEVPGDRLSFAVFIGREPDGLGLLGQRRKFLDNLAFVARNFIDRFVVLVQIDAEIFFREVPDMPKLDLTTKSLPRNFSMVLALAGDSTITKFSCITFSIFSLTQDNLSSYLGYPQVLRYFIIV